MKMPDRRLSELTVGDVLQGLCWVSLCLLLTLGGLLLWATQC